VREDGHTGRVGDLAAADQSLDVSLTTMAVRAILPPQAEPSSRAAMIANRLGQAIRLGLIRDREQFPSEARLAEQLNVSTVTLRDALARLREQGLVTTRRGRVGGTFVRAPSDPSAWLGQRLRQLSTQELRDLGDHRSAIAGTAAYLAAKRAMPDEIDNLRRQVDRLRRAETASERRRADTQLSIEIAAAAQSPRLTHEALRLRAEVGDLLWLQLDEREHAAAVRARTRLVATIGDRNASLARELAERQVESETARLLELRLRCYSVADAGGRTPRSAGDGNPRGSDAAKRRRSGTELS
jgi:DNA-binding FadR family transcriptional regulator